MPYKKEDLFKLAIEAIEKHKPLFIEDLVYFLPCVKSTFYDHFPIGSNESNELKELIEKNKIAQKSQLRKNWENEDSAPALQLALYKLLASPEEHEKLQMTYTDHRTKGDKITPPITWVDSDADSE